MIQSVLLQVSRKVLLHASRTEEVEQVPCESLPLPVWKGLPQAPVCPPGAIRWYGDTVVAKVTQWLWTAVAEERGPVVWISNAQRYVDYALQAGDAGPIHVRGWQDSADVPLHALQHIGFKERTRWFGMRQGVEGNPASCRYFCAVSLLQTGQPYGVYVCKLPCNALVCPAA